jgi:peptidoglycan/LPS O-acetylase OafA/YrhL
VDQVAEPGRGGADRLKLWSREPNLDFMRAVAVICVVLRHLTSVLPIPSTWWFQPQALGIFGVLLFFVHTSLVLMMSLERQQRLGDTVTWRFYCSFLLRRFFRIYPLSVLAVLLTYCYIVFTPSQSTDVPGIIARVDNSALVANLLLVQDLAHRDSLIAPLWSLPAEVQMYLVLPLLYLVTRSRGWKGILFVIWPLSVAIAVACAKLDLPFTGGRYAPCFVAGVLCFTLVGRPRGLPFWLFPIAILGSLAAYMAAYARVGMQAGLGIFVTLGLACAIPSFARLRSVCLKKVSHAIAKYSYGIYLFHVPCIWLTFGKLAFLGPLGSAVSLIVAVGLTSFAAFRLVEDPMIRLGQTFSARIARGDRTIDPRMTPAP